MLNSLSEYWGIVLLVIFLAGTGIRYWSVKKTGKLSQSKLDEWYMNTRLSFFESLDKFNTVLDIEKLSGRDAAREEITNIVRSYIKDSNFFTETEKIYILKLNLDAVVHEIENELIKLELLTPDEDDEESG